MSREVSLTLADSLYGAGRRRVKLPQSAVVGTLRLLIARSVGVPTGLVILHNANAWAGFDWPLTDTDVLPKDVRVEGVHSLNMVGELVPRNNSSPPPPNATGELSREQVLNLQEELLHRFSTKRFQKSLEDCAKEVEDLSPDEARRVFNQYLFQEQQHVLAKYGFQVNNGGVMAMVAAVNNYERETESNAFTDKINAKLSPPQLPNLPKVATSVRPAPRQSPEKRGVVEDSLPPDGRYEGDDRPFGDVDMKLFMEGLW
eukprot:NODE_13322_length_1172_cov_5.239234.p1 GENE.NODE_13322_length_1172_cov_5.239234~~NODE_13322_length_1172_cov_5.239234.p1  ORF type:complete len:258 (+),score=65.74 NODE_13322_length_1172_cov_5.239234:87-860(+)